MKKIHRPGHTARTALATTALAFCAAHFIASPEARAQLSIGDTSLTYTIDFDTTVAGVNDGAWTGTGFDVVPLPGQLDSDAWAVTGWSTGALAFGGTQTTGDFARLAATAAVTTGGMYAFSGGNITTGVALGIQPGGSDWAPGTLTLKIANTDTETITGFSLSYLVYVRNDQARGNSFNFSRSADDILYSPEASLNLLSGTAADVPALGFVSNTRSITFTGLSIAPGGFYYLRWNGADVNGSGSRDEFALDNIRLETFTTGVAVRNLVWTPTNNNWNTTETGNWLEGVVPVTFAATDNVAFNDSGLTGGGTVVVDAGGVTPGNITLSHTGGTYSFSGGPINGPGQLGITGGGTVVLTTANGYTGGTIVTAGTLSISNDNQLGGPAGNLTLSNSALLITANVSLAATRTLTSSGTIDLGANTLTINGPAALGATSLIGAGILSFAGASASVGALSISDAVTINSTTPVSYGGNITATNTTGTVTINAPLSTALARIITAADSDAAEDLVLTGAFSGTGRSTLAGAATSVIRLAGNSTGYAGGFRLNAGGPTVIVAHANALGDGQFFLNGGTLQGGIALTGANALPTPVSLGGNSLAFAGQNIEFSGAVTFFGTGAKTLTIPTGQTVALSGSLDSSSALTPPDADIVKAGPGKLVIGGNATAYNSTLIVAEGRADLTTTLGSGTASIQATAVLNIAATQTVANVTIDAGAVVTLGAPPPPAPEFVAGEEFAGAVIGGESVHAVPEPGTAALLLGGLATLLGRRRRRG